MLYPALTAAELLRSILEDLHIPAPGASLKDHVDALHRFLLEAREQNRDVVLLIDEAQDLSADVLEQIRLISNLETDTEKLIQIVLMGQSELQEMLSRRELRQLAQRVTAQYHLSPLSRSETEDYVAHRLRVAGGEGKVSFTPGALAVVHQRAGGVPRLINLICDRALLAGYVHGARVVDASMVRRAAREVRGVTTPEPLRRYAALAARLATAYATEFVRYRQQLDTASLQRARSEVQQKIDAQKAANVQAQQYRFSGGQRRLTSVGAGNPFADTTNDLGEIRLFAEHGSLFAYGPKMDEVYRQAATYVDKVLRGANPGDLPIGQATEFELIINLKTAKALGLTIPQSLLLRADQVIQ